MKWLAHRRRMRAYDRANNAYPLPFTSAAEMPPFVEPSAIVLVIAAIGAAVLIWWFLS